MQLILSTCGTSLLTNLAGEQRKLVIRHANARSAEAVPLEDRGALQALIDGLDSSLRAGSALAGLHRHMAGRGRGPCHRRGSGGAGRQRRGTPHHRPAHQ